MLPQPMPDVLNCVANLWMCTALEHQCESPYPEPPSADRSIMANSDRSMAVTFKDGVILGTASLLPITSLCVLLGMLTQSHPVAGADSRTTTGAYIANRVTDKLTKVHDTIWCCRSGSAADTQAVADIVQYQLGLFAMQSGKPPTTQTAAAVFQEICYANKDRLSYVAAISLSLWWRLAFRNLPAVLGICLIMCPG